MAGRCLTITCVTRHPQGSLGERDGADHRQELRRQADAQRDREEQRFEGVVLEHNAHQQDEQHQHDRRSKNQQTESPQPMFEFGFRRAAPQPHRDVAEHRLRTGRNRERRAGSADHRCAEKDQVGRVRPRRRALRRSAPSCRRAATRPSASIAGPTGRATRASRASAGTRSPAESRNTSPGTTLRSGISCHAPSRSTVAVGDTDARSRSAACCDR